MCSSRSAAESTSLASSPLKKILPLILFAGLGAAAVLWLPSEKEPAPPLGGSGGSSGQPATDQPVTDQPVTGQPVTGQAVSDQAVPAQPLTEAAPQEASALREHETPTESSPQPAPEGAVTEQALTEAVRKEAPASRRIRLETSAGTPLPHVPLRLGPASAGTYVMTDREGECTLRDLPSGEPARIVRRMLPFGKGKTFRLPKRDAEADGPEPIVLTMDDVGYYHFVLVDGEGQPTEGRADLQLSNWVGVKQHHEELGVLNERLWPVPIGLAEVNRRGSIKGRFAQEEWSLGTERLDRPGSASDPLRLELEVEPPTFLLTGYLDVKAPLNSLPSVYVVSGGREHSCKCQTTPDQSFRVAVASTSFVSSIEELVIDLPDSERLLPRRFVVTFDPPLEPGPHDLGLLNRQAESLIVSGVVRSVEGDPIAGVTPKLMLPESLQHAGVPSVAGFSIEGFRSSEGWFSFRSNAEGKFAIYGGAPTDERILWVGTQAQSWQSVKPLAFESGATGIELVVDHSISVVIDLEAQKQPKLRLEIVRLGNPGSLYFVAEDARNHTVLRLVPGDYELRVFDQESMELLTTRIGTVLDPAESVARGEPVGWVAAWKAVGW